MEPVHDYEENEPPPRANIANVSIGKVVIAVAAAVGALGVAHAQILVPSILNHARDIADGVVDRHEASSPHVLRQEFQEYRQAHERVRRAEMAESESRILRAIDAATKELREEIRKK